MKSDSRNRALQEVREEFIQGAGGIAASLLGMLNRVCGQIYALLYLSPEPLSLDDIVEQLHVSKGNVSINIRVLEDYQLVKKIWVKGSRRDFYQANDSLPKAVVQEFFDKISRNIKDSLDMISDCTQKLSDAEVALGQEALSEARFMRQRLELIRGFYQGAHSLFEAIYEGQSVNAALLKPILSRDR